MEAVMLGLISSVLLAFYLFLLIRPRYVHSWNVYRLGFLGFFAILLVQTLMLLSGSRGVHIAGCLVSMLATAWTLGGAFLCCYRGPAGDDHAGGIKNVLDQAVRKEDEEH
jgi:hypothetical protein